MVAQADADRIVALQGYERVKAESDEAAKDAKWWDEYVSACSKEGCCNGIITMIGKPPTLVGQDHWRIQS